MSAGSMSHGHATALPHRNGTRRGARLIRMRRGHTEIRYVAAHLAGGRAGFLTCASTLLEGDVARIVDGPPGRMLVSPTVDHWVS